MQPSGRDVAAQEFVAQAAGNIGPHVILVLLQPWEGNACPNVLALSQAEAALSPAEEHRLDNFSVVVAVTTYETEHDRRAAAKLLAAKRAQHCMVVLLIRTPGVEVTHEVKEIMLAKHEELLTAGFNKVLVDDVPEPAAVQHVLDVAYTTWTYSRKRLDNYLSMHPPAPDQAVLEGLRSTHKKILWRQIPRVLMPRFPEINTAVRETEQQVGNYLFLRPLRNAGGHTLIHVVDEDTQALAMMKMVDKQHILDATALESLYREMRFLKDMLSHENIIRLHEVMHTPWRIYFVFEHAVDELLSDLVVSREQHMLPSELALFVFSQICDAVAYCHGSEVALRNVAIDNILCHAEDSHHCKLMDFSCAVYCNCRSIAHAEHGTLPGMAPEMASGEGYMPHAGDCWSSGVVLLEMAGGLSSFASHVGYRETDALPDVSRTIVGAFQAEGSHARALSARSGMYDERVEMLLRKLMNVTPTQRATMRSVRLHLEDMEAHHLPPEDTGN